MRSDLFEFGAGVHRWTRAFISTSMCLVIVATAQSQPLLPMASRADVRAGQPGTAGALSGASAEDAAVSPDLSKDEVDAWPREAGRADPPQENSPQSDQPLADSLRMNPSQTDLSEMDSSQADPAQADSSVADASPAGATADAANDTFQASDADTHKSSPAPDDRQRMLARHRPLAPDAPITIAFHDADLGAALQAFAEFTGLNIVAGERVRGKTSLTLTRVPWRLAFKTFLEANGLAMQQSDGVIWVAPAAEVAVREKQRLEATARLNDLEPLAGRIFALRYQRAEDVRKLLAGSGNQRVLSKRGSAMADPRTDHLFVTDLPATLDQIAELLKVIDQPARQVLIESRIVEADESFARNLGAKLALLGKPEGATSKGVLADPQGNIFNLPAGGLSGYDAATLGTTLFSAGASRMLAIELNALEAQGRGRIVASPRIVTADRVRALIEQGTELPYQAQVDTGVSTVQFRRAGLKLEVVPHITPDHHVMLDVDVTKDSVGSATTAGPAINTKHIQTQVQVDNGGTVAIGGIYLQDERRDTTAVPWLGSLPVIGALFRHRAVQHSKSELMIFISPSEVIPLPADAPNALVPRAPRADDDVEPLPSAIPDIAWPASDPTLVSARQSTR
jgi:type IV pilus assembly protein PilQ